MNTKNNSNSTFASQSMTIRCLVLAVFALLFADRSFAEDRYVVIVNRNNPVMALSRIEAKQFYLKKKDRWGDSQRVAPVEIEGKSEIRTSFLSDVLGMNETGIRRYWIEMMYQHAVMPPQKVKTEAAAIEFVSRNTGAIGFVSVGKLGNNDRIKAVFEY